MGEICDEGKNGHGFHLNDAFKCRTDFSSGTTNSKEEEEKKTKTYLYTNFWSIVQTL